MTKKSNIKIYLIILFLLSFALIVLKHSSILSTEFLVSGENVKYAIPVQGSYKCEEGEDKRGLIINVPSGGRSITKDNVGFYTNGIEGIILSFTNSYWSTDWATRVGYAICDSNGNNCASYTYVTDVVGGTIRIPISDLNFKTESLKLIYQRMPVYIIGGWKDSEGLKVTYSGTAFNLRAYSSSNDPAGHVICESSCSLSCPSIGERQKMSFVQGDILDFYATAPYFEYWNTVDYDINQQGGATIYNEAKNEFCFSGTIYTASKMKMESGITYIYPDQNTRKYEDCCPGAVISSTYSDKICTDKYEWKIIEDDDELTCISDFNCPDSGNIICQNKKLSGYHCINKDLNGIGICKREEGKNVKCCLNSDCASDQVCEDYECKGGSPFPVCGDGKLDAGEECDLGSLNGKEDSGCTSSCEIVGTCGKESAKCGGFSDLSCCTGYTCVNKQCTSKTPFKYWDILFGALSGLLVFPLIYWLSKNMVDKKDLYLALWVSVMISIIIGIAIYSLIHWWLGLSWWSKLLLKFGTLGGIILYIIIAVFGVGFTVFGVGINLGGKRR